MSCRGQTTRYRLYPEPIILSEEEGIYEGLEMPGSGYPNRPYVVINMVSSVDGRTVVCGKASGIGSKTDRSVMREIRSNVDAVMVGAGTLRAERLDLGLDDPDAVQPLGVVVCGSGGLPIEERLVPGDRDVLLAVPESFSTSGFDELSERIRLVRIPDQGPGRVDLASLLRTLRTGYGVEHLLVEGGPAINRTLTEAGLVDEIFLTLAPKLLLGHESSIVAGNLPTDETQDLSLVSVHSTSDELFLRYRLRPGPKTS